MKNGKIKKYAQLSDKYLKDADDLLKKDDLSQASEKLWGSFAVIIKAVAAQRKKTIKSHDSISFFLTNISKELKDESLLNASLVANGLHQNFYEDSFTKEQVRKGTKTIRQFVARMKNRFSLE